MKPQIILALALLSCICSVAQTNKNAKVRKLLEVTGTAKNMKLMFDQSIAVQQRSNPTVDSTFWIEFKKELSVDSLVELVIPIYEKYCTEEDLDGLIAFYSTSLGQRVLQTMPLIQQESMVAGENFGKEVGERVMMRIQDKKQSPRSSK